MKRILTALVLIPVVLLLVFLGPHWLVTMATAALAALAGWEYLGIAERAGPRPPRIALMVAIAALFVGNFNYPDQTANLFGVLSLSLLVYCTFTSSQELMLADAAISIFGFAYVGLTLLSLPALREQANGPLWSPSCSAWSGPGISSPFTLAAPSAATNWHPVSAPTRPGRAQPASVAGSLLVAGGLLALAHLLAVAI